jgi:DNA-directed RNA polymerase sigma subunit (sigma70/sigma32)
MPGKRFRTSTTRKRHYKNEEAVLRQTVEEVVEFLRNTGRQKAADIIAFRFCIGREKTPTDFHTLHEVADRFDVSYEYVMLLEEQEIRPRFTRLLRQQNRSDNA